MKIPLSNIQTKTGAFQVQVAPRSLKDRQLCFQIPGNQIKFQILLGDWGRPPAPADAAYPISFLVESMPSCFPLDKAMSSWP
jgi:hypothetical protein